MDKRLVVVIILVCVIIVGFGKSVMKIRRYNERLNYTQKYRAKFVDLLNNLGKSKRLDMELYQELVRDVDKMQQELGLDGIISEMIDPIRGLKYREYQLLINFLPELRQEVNEIYYLERRIMDQAGMCDDMFIRHIGNLERAKEKISKNLYNPFTCFAQGVRGILDLPVNMLYWCGILNENYSARILNSKISKFIQNIIVFVGLLSSIATLVLGWEELITILNNVIGQFTH